MVETISNKENLTLEDTVQKEFNKLSNVSADEIISKSKYKTIILPNWDKIIKNSDWKEVLRIGIGSKMQEKNWSKEPVNKPIQKVNNNQIEKKNTSINTKESDAQNNSFFTQKLYIKKDGKYMSAELTRKDIIFKKWEKVLLYRDPWIMDNGWIYEWNWKVSKIKDGTKYMVKNISNAFVYKENETSILFSQIAYQARKIEYLKKNVCMKETLFDKYFSKDSLSLEDGQGNIGNCYMVAAFRALMESPNYETLIRTSVNIDNSKWNDKWIATVKIPLWVKNAKEYKIYPRDVMPQKNKFYNPDVVIPPQKVPMQSVKWSPTKGKYYPEYTKRSDGKLEPVIMSKSREYLTPLKWPIWIKILEAAYVKIKDNWNNDSAAWWFDRLKIEWWMWWSAIIDIIWETQWEPEDVWTFWSKSLSDQKLLEKSYKYFDGFLQYRDYGTLATKNWEGKDDTHFYNIPWINQKIVYKHAYTIIDTDPLNKTVTIVNPWKLDKPFKISYNQTCQAFSMISWIWVDFDKSFRS